jgi:hypothetical protein
MSLHIYHPNKSNSGFACSFSLSNKDGEFYTQFLKQDGWDEKRKIGLFKGSRQDPLKNTNIKLSKFEVGGILDCIERNRSFSQYHDFDNTPKGIKFEPYIPKNGDGTQKGFSFSVSVTSKEDSTYKNGFYIALTYAEARTLREFLIFSLHKVWTISEDNETTTYDYRKNPTVVTSSQEVQADPQRTDNTDPFTGL